MKNRLFTPLVVFLFLFGLNHTMIAQSSVTKKFYETLMVEDTTSIKYWEDTMVRKQYADSALTLLRLYPADKYSAFLLRFHINNLLMDSFSRERYDSMKALVSKYSSGFPASWITYSHLTSIYLILGVSANNLNDFISKKEYEQLGLKYAEMAVRAAESEGNEKYRLLAIYKLHNLYNNHGNTLYAATHHLDPKVKRNKVGPLIENYFLKADSCYDIFFQGGGAGINKDSCFRVDPTIKINLAALYGHYYHNDLKSKFYYQLSADIIEKCPSQHYQAHYLVSQAWVDYCWENYDSALPKLMRAIPLFDSYDRLLFDAYFLVTHSYFIKEEYDSALKYGTILFQDTAHIQEHVNMSMVASAMSEIYLLRNNVDLARIYLQLSKKYLAKSQHNLVVDEFIKEGETIMVNQIVERLGNLTKDLDQAERNSERLKLIVWLLVAGVALVGSGFFIYRIRAIKSLPWQSQ